MNILNFQLVIVVWCILQLSACSWSVESEDPVESGSLTLTPLKIPSDLSPPNRKGALMVPSLDSDNLPVDEGDIAVPPPLNLAAAKAEASVLLSDTAADKKKLTTLSSKLQYAPDGQGILKFAANYDRVWENMDGVLTKLGFKVEDRDRSKNIYQVSRELPKKLIQEIEEKETGVARDIGQKEQYQIFVENKSKTSTEVSVRNPAGQPDSSSLAKHLLVQIKAVFEQSIEQ